MFEVFFQCLNWASLVSSKGSSVEDEKETQ